MENNAETGGGTGAGEEYVLAYRHLPGNPRNFVEDPLLSIFVRTETGEFCSGGRGYAKGGSELNYSKLGGIEGGIEGGIKKIAVGLTHCAALTHDGRLMIWEHKSFSEVDSADCIKLRKFKSNERCLSCSDDCTDMYGLAYCDTCGLYQPGREKSSDEEEPSDDDDCEYIAISKKERTLLCPACTQPQTTKTIKTWDLVVCKSMTATVVFCPSCMKFIKTSYYRCTINMNYADNSSVRTILGKNDERIKDVAFRGVSLQWLLENNSLYSRLLFPSLDFEHRMALQTNETFSTREIVAVYGGLTQFFVKYEDGSLFKCPDELIIIKEDTCVFLREVKLPAAVDKVCCGFHCTGVLLNDGSVWFIASDSTTRLVHESGLSVFTDLAVIANTDLFLVQAPTGTRVHGSEKKITLMCHLQLSSASFKVVVEFYESALNTVLKEMVLPTPRTEDSSNITATTLPIPNLPQSTPNMAQLYGNSYLADMTIKLADEELPAHSSILFATSSHFQKTFNADNPPPKVLDVSHYNPQAYKYLLQYYYQTQPDDLDGEGFVHLRHLAASYGETSLADAATAKVKSLLCEDNVERIFALSKRFDFQDLTIECERIMRSPPFIEKLLETTMKNLATSEETSPWQLFVSAPSQGRVKK